MGIVSVTANINGHECHFKNAGGDVWTATAPSDCPNGCYVCSFWAEDEAHNIAYCTALLWIYDGRFTCIKWIKEKYNIKYLNNNIRIMLKDVDYSVRVKESPYSLHSLPEKYSIRYIQRVRCRA